MELLWMKNSFRTSLLTVALLSMLLSACATPPKPASTGPTEVSGALDQDQTWTAAASPYLLKGTLVIDEGYTLKIEAGSTIIAGRGARIIVKGRIKALGTAQRPVLFTGPKDRGIGSWPGIFFRNTTGAKSTLQGVVIEKAQCAIFSDGAPLVITASTLRNNKVGISAEQKSKLTIEQTQFINNGTFESFPAAINIVAQAQVTLTGSTFRDNLGPVISISANSKLDCDNSSFTANLGPALKIGATATVNFVNNQIFDQAYGLQVAQAVPVIAGNTFTGLTQNAIALTEGAGALVYDNRFVRCKLAFWSLAGHSLLKNNEFRENTQAIVLEHGATAPKIENCNFYGNEHSFSLQGITRVLKLKNPYWEDLDSLTKDPTYSNAIIGANMVNPGKIGSKPSRISRHVSLRQARSERQKAATWVAQVTSNFPVGRTLERFLMRSAHRPTVLYSGYSNGNANIYRFDLLSNQAQSMTHLNRYSGDPIWAGKHIICYTEINPETDLATLVLVRSDNGAERHLAHPGATANTWSPVWASLLRRLIYKVGDPNLKPKFSSARMVGGGNAPVSPAQLANSQTGYGYYRPKLNTWAAPATERASNTQEDAIVLTTDTVWEQRNKAHFFNKNVVVAKGVTLRVMPGAKVVFNQNGGQMTGLTVFGRLLAIGTSKEPVLFAGATPQQVSWRGISFQGGTLQESRVEYSIIRNAAVGIHCVQSSPKIYNNLFQNCLLAICCEQGSNAHIARNLITACGEFRDAPAGIAVLLGSAPTIFRNNLQGNTGHAISVEVLSAPTITFNKIMDNTGAGIISYSHSRPVISENFISNNAAAISSFSSWPQILRNKILANKAGLMLHSSIASVSDNFIEENQSGLILNDSIALVDRNVFSNKSTDLTLINSENSLVKYNSFAATPTAIHYFPQIISENLGGNYWPKPGKWDIAQLGSSNKNQLVGRQNSQPAPQRRKQARKAPTITDHAFYADFLPVHSTEQTPLNHLHRTSDKFYYFAAPRNGSWDLYALDRSTMAEQELTNSQNNQFAPAISPDQRSLLYSGERQRRQQLFLFDLAENSTRQLTSGATEYDCGSWSEDGHSFYGFLKGTNKVLTGRVRQKTPRMQELGPEASKSFSASHRSPLF